jgi:hypothetical protein
MNFDEIIPENIGSPLVEVHLQYKEAFCPWTQNHLGECNVGFFFLKQPVSNIQAQWIRGQHVHVTSRLLCIFTCTTPHKIECAISPPKRVTRPLHTLQFTRGQGLKYSQLIEPTLLETKKVSGKLLGTLPK